jgi:hypothetical protein
MPLAKDFFSKNDGVVALISGHYGTGKTFQAMSFPQVYYIGCDPAGLDCVDGHDFQNNLVAGEYLLAQSKKDLSGIFERVRDSKTTDSIYGCLNAAVEMAKAGEVKTLFVDGLTYLNLHCKNDLWQNKPILTNSGELDTQRMYGALGSIMQSFFLQDILPLSTRHKLNVVVTCHVQRLSDEQREGVTSPNKKGVDAKKKRAIVTACDLAPKLEGGIRDLIEGMFSTSLYIEKKIIAMNEKTHPRGMQYLLYTDYAMGFDGTLVTAKNRYRLPGPKVDITEKNLYQFIQKARGRL